MGFASSDLAMIATAISELARNILRYARCGEIICRVIEKGGRRGLIVEARDSGPGIADVEMALKDGYSTSGGLGLGLPGARRLMDEFEVTSQSGRGTHVLATKWR